jgi:hypothetical protein
MKTMYCTAWLKGVIYMAGVTADLTWVYNMNTDVNILLPEPSLCGTH